MMECGKAPALWKDEMARATAWLDGPRIASAWVRSWGIYAQLGLLQEPLTGHCLAEVLGADDRVEKVPEQASLRRRPIVLPHKPSLSEIMEIREWHREHSRHGFKDRFATGIVPAVSSPTSEHTRPAGYSERPDLHTVESPRRSAVNMSLPELDIDDGSAIVPGHPPSSHDFKSRNEMAARNRRHPRTNGQVPEFDVQGDEPAISSDTIAKRPRRPEAVLPGVDMHASRDLLSRLAGDIPTDQQEQQMRPIIWPSASQRKSPVMYGRDVADLTDHRGWLTSLAETAARSLYQIDPSGTLDSGKTRQISPPEITHLESQLMIPILGPRATSQLLSVASMGDSTRFKGRASGFDMVDNPDCRFKRDMQSGPDGKLRASSHIESSGQTQSRPAVGQNFVRDPVLGQDMVERVLPGMRMRSKRGITDTGGGQDEKDQIVPLEAEPSLPPLHSSQGAKMPSLPVAAPIARSDAQKGLIEDDADLGDLAAKIKRILDDEARRHGIDV